VTGLDDLLAALGYERPAWQADAACRGMGPDRFFPERGASSRPALDVCSTCPVMNECREFGLEERAGTWGGTTGNDRRRIRARRAKDTAA
jgi:WhiB family redox-sensing transcriptional regulator